MTDHPNQPAAHGGGQPDRERRTDELLLAVGLGDLNALGAFYDATAATEYALLRTALGCPTRARQALQQGYLELWAGAASFDPATTSARTQLRRATLRQLAHQITPRPAHRDDAHGPAGAADDPTDPNKP